MNPANIQAQAVYQLVDQLLKKGDLDPMAKVAALFTGIETEFVNIKQLKSYNKILTGVHALLGAGFAAYFVRVSRYGPHKNRKIIPRVVPCLPKPPSAALWLTAWVNAAK